MVLTKLEFNDGFSELPANSSLPRNSEKLEFSVTSGIFLQLGNNKYKCYPTGQIIESPLLFLFFYLPFLFLTLCPEGLPTEGTELSSNGGG